MHRPSLLPTLIATAMLSLVASAANAVVYLNIVEVPPRQAPKVKTGLFGKQSVANEGATSPVLSERYSATKEGKRYERRTTDKWPNETNRIVVYKCPQVLSMSRRSNTEVIIDVSKQRVYLMINGMMGLETQVSTARSDKETPRGKFAMTERVRDGKISNLYDVEMPFWMRLGDTAYGVHAGYLPGYPASAGCIRLPQHAAEIVFENTQRGTPVRIYTNWRAPSATGRAPVATPIRRPGKTKDGYEVDSYGQTIRRIRI